MQMSSCLFDINYIQDVCEDSNSCLHSALGSVADCRQSELMNQYTLFHRSLGLDLGALMEEMRKVVLPCRTVLV